MSGSPNKTKDWLKAQLVNHGVPLPSSTAKKEEYQRLYDEQVLPQQGNSEFSSDDDMESTQDREPSRAPSVAKQTSSGGTKSGKALEERRTAWIEKLTDQNLFEALSACSKQTGPIVDSTRQLYRMMLLDLLNKDEHQVMEWIGSYLSQQPDAKNDWNENGLLEYEFNGVTNGNSENGYSDTDDEETVETASRASRTSSKRSTPARTPRSPTKNAVPSTPLSSSRTILESEIRARRGGTGLREQPFVSDDIDEMDETPGPSSNMYFRTNTPLSVGRVQPPRKRVVESYEETRMYRETSGMYQPDPSQQFLNSPTKQTGTPRSKKRFVFYVMLLVLVALMAYLFYILQTPSDCTGPECNDELDLILKNLDAHDGGQDHTGGEA